MTAYINGKGLQLLSKVLLGEREVNAKTALY